MFNRIFLQVLLFLSLSQIAHAEDSELKRGPFRFALKAAFAKDFVIASSDSFQKEIELLKTLEIGPAATFEYQLLDFLSLGVQYQSLFEIGSKVAYQDFDVVTKFIFSSSKNDKSELFFAIPAGLSVMTDGNGLFATGTGFNLGAFVGGNYFFNNYLGASYEVGYLYRRINTKIEHMKIDFNFHEIAASLGLIVRF
jgi:hypothetical protein